jgi:competence protein ComGC
LFFTVVTVQRFALFAILHQLNAPLPRGADKDWGTKMLKRVKEIASLLRDLGVILGVPALVGIGLNINDLQNKAHDRQIKALEAQNSVLRETQFDRAVALIEAQKKAYDLDRANTANELNQLKTKLDESAKQYSGDLKKIIRQERECLTRVVSLLGSRLFSHGADKKTEDETLKLMTDAAGQICAPL